MGEIKSEIKLIPYELKYLCDNCGDSCVEFTGKTLMSNPVKYEHQCMSCANVMNLSKVYPYIGYDKYYLIKEKKIY